MERRRRIASYVMLVGFFGAGLLAALGLRNYSRATERIDALVKDCEIVRRSWTMKTASVPVLSCEPSALEIWVDESVSERQTWKDLVAAGKLVPVPPGATFVAPEHAEAAKVQAWYDQMQRFADRILAENNEREGNWSDSELTAIAIALALTLPRLWYFLLGRFAELASAIRGNP